MREMVYVPGPTGTVAVVARDVSSVVRQDQVVDVHLIGGTVIEIKFPHRDEASDFLTKLIQEVNETVRRVNV